MSKQNDNMIKIWEGWPNQETSKEIHISSQEDKDLKWIDWKQAGEILGYKSKQSVRKWVNRNNWRCKRLTTGSKKVLLVKISPQQARTEKIYHSLSTNQFSGSSKGVKNLPLKFTPYLSLVKQEKDQDRREKKDLYKSNNRKSWIIGILSTLLVVVIGLGVASYYFLFPKLRGYVKKQQESYQQRIAELQEKYNNLQKSYNNLTSKYIYELEKLRQKINKLRTKGEKEEKVKENEKIPTSKR